MTDDLDIEALLEAPFRTETSPAASSYSARRDESVKEDLRGRRDGRHRSSSRDGQMDGRDHYRHGKALPSESQSGVKHTSLDSDGKSRRYSTRSRSRSPHGRHSRDCHRSRSPPRPSHYHHSASSASSGSVVLTEAQRDRRTVFCRQLAQRLDSRQLKEFCEQAGRVRDARIVYDKISKRSKGVGYVEFYDEESVPMAVALTGKKLLAIPIIVELTETEKNRIAEEAAAALRLEKLAAATANVAPTKSSIPQNHLDSDACLNRSKFGDEHHDESLEAMERILSPDNAVNITEMMLRMARDTSTLKGLASTRPSSCVLLQHMYDPLVETEPEWDFEITEEVREECTKFGRVEHIHVPKTTEGDVFVRFASTDSAQAAVASLNGRWFGGLQVTALYIPLSDYLSRYPK